MILLAANTISVMLVPCIHKTVLQLRITLLPKLANHGVELGFGVSNGLTPHNPSGDYTSYSVGSELACSGDDGNYHTAAQTRRTRKQAP
jgi:hypothetical protein